MVRDARHITESELTAALRALAVRPSPRQVDPDLLDAYLEGTASPENVERLQGLLAESGELREELIGLAAVASGTLEFQALPRPAVPRRRGKHEPSQSLRLIVGLAAVLAIVVGLSHGVRHKPGKLLALVADQAYQEEQFEADELRGPGPPDAPRVARDHREAALSAFRQEIRWTEGGGVREVPVPLAKPPHGERTITFRTSARSTYQAVLPAEASDCRLAILNLPALTLSWADLPSVGADFQVALPTEAVPGAQVLMAVAFRTPSGFAATLAAPR